MPSEDIESLWMTAISEASVKIKDFPKIEIYPEQQQQQQQQFKNQEESETTHTTSPSIKVSESLQKQISRIAEKAFWDSVQERLASDSGDAAKQVSQMLAEIGSDLAEALPNTSSAKVVSDLFNERELFKLLQSDESQDLNGIDTDGLLQLLDHTAQLIREYGSEARNEIAVKTQQIVREQIIKAIDTVSSSEDKKSLLSKSVTNALKLLYAQLKVFYYQK